MTNSRQQPASWDRLLAVTRRHPLVADAALAAVIFLLSVPPSTALAGTSPAWSLVLVLALVVPLVWRRRAPFVVLLICIVPALFQLFTGKQITDYLALLVAFYTVVVCSAPWRGLAGGALLEAGAVLGAERAGGSGRDGTLTGGSHAVLVWGLATCLIVVTGLLGYYVRTTRRAQRLAQAERAERAEREREQQAELAASAERARIAREMHDIVAHNIAVMIALADGAACTTKADPDQAASLMGQVSATGRTALTEMRRLLGVLREPAEPGSAPQPGLADLDRLLAAVRAAGLRVELAASGPAFPLPPSAQLAVYRMAQEALTNTLKHAPGAAAQVKLRYRPGGVELEVIDDGPPVVPDGRTGKSGHGIAGMRERAAVFGGDVSAGSRPGGGWRVHTVLHLGPAGTEDLAGTKDT